MNHLLAQRAISRSAIKPGQPGAKALMDLRQVTATYFDGHIPESTIRWLDLPLPASKPSLEPGV